MVLTYENIFQYYAVRIIYWHFGILFIGALELKFTILYFKYRSNVVNNYNTTNTKWMRGIS